MKTPFYIISVLLTAAAFMTGCKSKTELPPLPTVAGVSLKRYAGHWHEVFRLPNEFQKDDARAEADYEVQADGSVSVVNTETRPDGTRKTATGTATAVPDGKNSRLRVKFTGLAALVPVPEEGNYWIIKLAPDYSTALVGTPDRKYLWMLSRTRKAAPETLSAYKTEAQRLGFDTSKLLYH